MLSRLYAGLIRLREFFFRSRIAGEQEEEFRFHLEMEIENNRRAGMSDEMARRAATIAFGGQQRYREETRDARGIVTLDTLLREIVFALRRIRRSPGFASSAIATLGIGIGAAAGIGAIVYGVLLRDLPYPNANALVRVSLTTPGIAASSDLLSGASYFHLATGARSFDGIGAYYTNDGINITDGDVAERATAAMVTPGTFRMLYATPIVGSLFAESDTSWAQSIPVLISQDLWERRYGRDPNIIGRKIDINRGARRVIGVLPRSFDFPSPAVSIWYPMTLDLKGPSLTDRYYNVIARLRAGVSADAAQAELNTLLPGLASRFPSITPDAIRRSGAHVTVESSKTAMVAPVRGQLVLLGIMVLVVLLIATTNIVSLFLLRAERAGREIAIALSLGAGRADIARRFVVEGMILGAASLVVALPVAAIALATKLGFSARDIPRLHEITFDAKTIAVVVAAALVIGAAIGFAALTRTGTAHLVYSLRGTHATTSLGWRRVQRGLVAMQIAFAFVLLVAAGLLGRSFWNLRNVKLGFDPVNATTFDVSLPYSGYASYGESAIFHARVVDRLRALPGVTDAVAALQLPLAERDGPATSVRLELIDGDAHAVVPAQVNIAASEYFRVMAIPLRRGRTFAPGDVHVDAPAIVLSETLARALFGFDNPLGRRIRRTPEPRARPMVFQVIGVVGDVLGSRIEDGPELTAYFPLLRDGDGTPKDSFPALPLVPRSARYVIRTGAPGVAPSAQTIRAVIHDLDRRVPAVQIRPMSALVDAATARVRLTLLLLGIAGGAALLLGVVGVYSVVSYAAAGRLREFGVRMAFGATPGRVASMILNEGASLAAVGIVFGLMIAAVGTRFMRSLLFGVSPMSAPEFVAAAVLLAVVTLLATFIPARRASRTDPAVVLRGE